TKKEWDYIKFKKGLNAKLTANKEQLTELLVLEKPSEYQSSFWEQKKSLTKPWILGFIEAEGSYYITKKDISRYVHGFGITQKEDVHVLEAIKKSLHITTKIKKRSDSFLLDTTNSRAIENIIEYSEKSLIGMKAIECRIWSRSYRKHKGDYKKLKEIQGLIRKMKEKMKITQDEGIVRTIMEVIESNDNTNIKV
ncbi:hypothetical protein ACTFIZ_005870, partial [Dictyostelium cf. discoideum]